MTEVARQKRWGVNSPTRRSQRKIYTVSTTGTQFIINTTKTTGVMTTISTTSSTATQDHRNTETNCERTSET